MGRRPCCAKVGLNKGAWSAMEDKVLSDYIKLHGEGKWRDLPEKAGIYLLMPFYAIIFSYLGFLSTRKNK